MTAVLEVRDLAVERAGRPALRGVSLAVEQGTSVGIVGPSGSGKTTLALAVIGLLPARCSATGSVRIGGVETVGLPERAMSRLRGTAVSMVFQDPAAALNPVLPVGRQIAEAVRAHRPVSRRAAAVRAAELLELVGVARDQQRLDALPSQLSGGLRQRVVIAIAVANSPQVLLADEPFTDLDALGAAQVLDALDQARRASGSAVVVISHDLALIAHRVEQVVVMDGGTVVEAGDVSSVLADPHSGTAVRLLASRVTRRPPRSTRPAEVTPDSPPGATGTPVPSTYGAAGAPVLSAHDLVKDFPRHALVAVDGVSFDLCEGTTLGLVGESGSGKTTVVRMLMGLVPPTSGEVRFRGERVAAMDRSARTAMRARVQVVFQDPFRSLDPHMTVSRIVAEPLRIHSRGGDLDGRVAELLSAVGLDPAFGSRRPHVLSAGERQRVAIARAMALRPEVLLLDEPVSSLDTVTQAGVLDLLLGLQDRFGLTYLFVSHDLAVVRAVADQVAVMLAGRIVEAGPVDDVFSRPQHPYTRALLEASPDLRLRRVVPKK